MEDVKPKIESVDAAIEAVATATESESEVGAEESLNHSSALDESVDRSSADATPDHDHLTPDRNSKAVKKKAQVLLPSQVSPRGLRTLLPGNLSVVITTTAFH